MDQLGRKIQGHVGIMNTLFWSLYHHLVGDTLKDLVDPISMETLALDPYFSINAVNKLKVGAGVVDYTLWLLLSADRSENLSGCTTFPHFGSTNLTPISLFYAVVIHTYNTALHLCLTLKSVGVLSFLF